GPRLRLDGERARGAGHRLISAIHRVRGNQGSGIGQRNGAIRGDLEGQLRTITDRGWNCSRSHVTVITVDDIGTVGLAGRTVPEFPYGPVIQRIVVAYSSVRSAAQADVTNIR